MNEDVASAVQMRKAQQALKSSRTLLNEGDTEGACNRAYYAMFHAAHVALNAVGRLEPGAIFKTHRGLISAFSQHLVATGRLADRFGRSLSKVHDTRLIADYAGETPDAATTAWIVGEAEAFVAMISATFEAGDSTRQS